MDLPYLPPQDCALVCDDGREAHCHSLLLLLTGSPVLANIIDKVPGDSKLLTIPFQASSSTAAKFLAWLYRRGEPQLGLLEAVQLAEISHEWGIDSESAFMNDEWDVFPLAGIEGHEDPDVGLLQACWSIAIRSLQTLQTSMSLAKTAFSACRSIIRSWRTCGQPQ